MCVEGETQPAPAVVATMAKSAAGSTDRAERSQ
jgi:hypothetical protein